MSEGGSWIDSGPVEVDPASILSSASERYRSDPGLSTFMEAINTVCGRGEVGTLSTLSTEDPLSSLDSLELLLLLFFMEEVGAEVPPDMLPVLAHLQDLHFHAMRRLGFDPS